jgi:hypothetical protein
MTREDYGTPPSTPYEVVTLSALYANLPSYSQTITTGTSFTISTLPASPVDHTMYLLEVNATATIQVTIPGTVIATIGVPVGSTTVFSGKTGFFGFRYSATKPGWFLLSSTSQL